MNYTLETRGPAKAATKARAIRVVRTAEQFDIIGAVKNLQAQRLRAMLGCSEAMAFTLASLAYGEARV